MLLGPAWHEREHERLAAPVLHYPKETNFATLSQTHINRVVEELKNRPRKRLGCRTPAEMFWGEYSGAL